MAGKMMAHSPHEGFKDTLRHVWHNKPLFWTMVIGLVVVGYILYKKNSAAAVAPGSTSNTAANGTPGSYSNTYINVSKTMIPGAPAPTSPHSGIPGVVPVPVVNPKGPKPKIWIPPKKKVGGLPTSAPDPRTHPADPKNNPTVGSQPSTNPIIPFGMLPAGSHPMGSTITWMGAIYTVDPGNAGRIWGVPGKVSIQQAISTPIPPKVLLYGPISDYH